jgi:hypothetical protein
VPGNGTKSGGGNGVRSGSFAKKAVSPITKPALLSSLPQHFKGPTHGLSCSLPQRGGPNPCAPFEDMSMHPVAPEEKGAVVQSHASSLMNLWSNLRSIDLCLLGFASPIHQPDD